MTISLVGVSNRKACQKVIWEQTQLLLLPIGSSASKSTIQSSIKSLEVSSTIFNIAALKAVAIKITESIGV